MGVASVLRGTADDLRSIRARGGIGALSRTESRDRLACFARSALLSILAFCLVYFLIDPKLIYHGIGQFLIYLIYVPGTTTLLDAPPFPGGVAEYLAAVLSHCFYYSWAGALIISAVAGLLWLATGKLLTALGGQQWRPLRFLPAILWLMRCGRYDPYPVDGVSLLIGLGCTYLYLRLPWSRAVPRLIVFLAFSAVVYPAAASAYPIFVVFCVIFELLIRRNRAVVIAWGAGALLVPYLSGALLFPIAPIEAYRFLLPIHTGAERIGAVLTFILFLFFPIAGICCAVRPGRASAPIGRVLERFGWGRLKWAAETSTLLIATAGAVFWAHDPNARLRLRINYFARQQMWPEVLREARRLPVEQYTPFAAKDVNRALFHTGRLAYDMFSYPQHVRGPLVNPAQKSARGRLARILKDLQRSELESELGYINGAEHSALVALERANYNPLALQRLALIAVVKGQTEAARNYLYALKKDFLYRNWAESYLRRLRTDPLLSADGQVRRMRSVMLRKDRSGPQTRKNYFLALLEQNSRNRMAFEYLMASSLLAGDCADVVRRIKDLDQLGYPEGEIPRSYEEAVLVYAQITGSFPDLYGRQVNPAAVVRFREFLARRRELHGERQRVAETLAADFGDTFYYYYTVRLAK